LPDFFVDICRLLIRQLITVFSLAGDRPNAFVLILLAQYRIRRDLFVERAVDDDDNGDDVVVVVE
jgi:hypothetical protein